MRLSSLKFIGGTEYSQGPGMDELLDFVDPEGEVYISGACAYDQAGQRQRST